MEQNQNLFDDVTELLKIHGLTYRWLRDRLVEAGCDVHKVSLSKWVHGVQVAQKAVVVHDMSLKILDEYCKSFAEKVKSL